jgi:peptide chain release factor 2
VITFDPDALSTRVAELEQSMGEPGFWDDQKRAAAISSEHARLARRRERYDSLAGDADDLAQLLELSSDDGELEEVDDAVSDLKSRLQRVQEDALFSGEYDSGDAVVSIHAGEGGTDAQDWAEMLLRMYLRWAEGRGYETELLEASPGE